MRIEVNGVRLFFDVEGAKLVPDGPVMREKPTLLLLHGGPGIGDHSGFKPGFSRFADVCQVIYLDHRANGRSDRGAEDRWTLAQWGDDVRAFCEALEIEKPIVMGQSFGGFVAMSYATRHPEHPAKLILSSTFARHVVERSLATFERRGGAEAREAAFRFNELGERETFQEFMRVCTPLYGTTPRDAEAGRRPVLNLRTMYTFWNGERRTFDLRDDLAHIQCPTLVLGGEEDPETPIQDQADIAAAIRPDLVRFERVADAGHGPYRDDPRVFDKIRDFILS